MAARLRWLLEPLANDWSLGWTEINPPNSTFPCKGLESAFRRAILHAWKKSATALRLPFLQWSGRS